MLAPHTDKTIDLSFIVPARNIEKYIGECIRSLLCAQNMRVEVILVDDASSDGTVETAKKNAAQLNCADRLLTFRTGDQPIGLGAARNAGAERASGRYISFVDSDDWICASTYANTLNLCDRFNADFGWLRTQCYSELNGAFTAFNDHSLVAKIIGDNPFTITNLESSPLIAGLEPSCCNRVFQQEFFKSRVGPFPAGTLYEDFKTHFRAMAKAERIVLVRETGYYYRLDRIGQLTARKDEALFQSIGVFEDVVRFLRIQKHILPSAPFALKYLLIFLTWIVSSLPFPLRRKFLQQSVEAFQHVPNQWVSALIHSGDIEREWKLRAAMFVSGDVNSLLKTTGGLSPIYVRKLKYAAILQWHRLFPSPIA